MSDLLSKVISKWMIVTLFNYMTMDRKNHSDLVLSLGKSEGRV